MAKPVEIAGRLAGPGAPCLVIAEAGVNHNGRLDLACRLVDRALEAGADAVKFQTFQTEQLVTREAPKAEYQVQATGAQESQYEMLRRLELSPADHRALLAHCQDRGILFLSTPFDEGSADLLDELGVPAFKIGSGELTNWPFLEHVARKGRPLILSTGMSYLSEVDEALRVISHAGCDQVVLLHCVSNYPADPADVNLRAIQTMAAAFNLPVGYSDHTLGESVALAAVALGACVIEKHFTLDRGLPGPDHRASLEPAELASLVRSIRLVEKALGDGTKRPAAAEESARAVGRRSIVAARAIAAGTVLTREMLAAKRPASGLPPAWMDLLVGRTAGVDIPVNTLIALEMVR